ncbi:hypothetical protein F4Y93_07485, partial [Candidatus Poribacteria bacterium]|nr:hypothetical protein [Candidatus Poribacteria bacterium]
MANNVISRKQPDTSLVRRVYEGGFDWKLLLVGALFVVVGQFLVIQTAGPEHEGIPPNGRNALALGFAIVALAAYFFNSRLRQDKWIVKLPTTTKFSTSGPRSILFGLGVASFAFLSLRLLGGSTSGGDLWVWIVSLLGIGSAFAPSYLRVLVGLRRAARSIRRVDVAIVVALMAILMLLNTDDLTDWYYSAIGDEYSFFDLSRQFAAEGISNPFSQRGVDDYHPRLGLMMKVAVMKTVGINHFGWKFSSILMLALTIPAMYVAGTLMAGRIAGASAASVIAFSHYLGAIAHVGYDHIDSLLPTAWAVAFFLLATRNRSPGIMFCAGALAGLCLYTYIPARVVFPTILVFVAFQVFSRSPQNVIRWILPWIVAVFVAVLPMLIVSGDEVVTQMLGRVIGGQGEPSDLGLIDRIVTNIELNLFAFNFNEHISHYVSGSLFDPITASIAVVAVGFTIGGLRDHSSILLLVWLGLAFAATGLISPYGHTATTRLFPMIPPIALMIGMFASRFVWPIDINFLSSSGARVISPKAITITALVVICATVLMLNFQRLRTETPSVFHNSPVAVSLRAFESEPCTRFADDQILFISRDEHIIRRVLDSYEPGSIYTNPEQASEFPGIPKFLNHEQAIEHD